MPYRLMHISDLHAGPPFNPQIAAHVAELARQIAPDLLVISGDFVQRADFLSQWRTVQQFVETLPRPILPVPGNHDVPLLNLFARLFTPLRHYQRHISADLYPVFEQPGLAVVGACTAHGLTGDGGKLSSQTAATLEQRLQQYGSDVCKIVVWHHPVINPPGLKRQREMAGHVDAVRLLDRCDVDLLLCGHLHVSYVGNTLDVRNDLRHGTIICQSGTTTSRRGFGRERGRNSFNLIDIEEQQIRIKHYLYFQSQGSFLPAAEHRFPRRTVHTYESFDSARD